MNSSIYLTPIALLSAKLDEMTRHRDHVAAELDQAEVDAKPIDVESRVKEVADRVWNLADQVTSTEPAIQREALSQFVERIDLKFSECPRGKKMEYRPTTGEIVFRGGSHSFASRGDRI